MPDQNGSNDGQTNGGGQQPPADAQGSPAAPQQPPSAEQPGQSSSPYAPPSDGASYGQGGAYGQGNAYGQGDPQGSGDPYGQSGQQAGGGQQQPPYAPPAQTPPPGGQYPGEAPQRQPGSEAPLNALSLVAFIGSFFISLVGIVCGHIALSQIKKSGERGRGFALAGTIIGYVALALTVLGIVFSLVLGNILWSTANTLTEQSQGGPSTSEETPAPEDDASGSTDGQSTPGEVTAATCDQIRLINELRVEDVDNTGRQPQELVDLYEELATLPSTNQSIYAEYAEYADAPPSEYNDQFDIEHEFISATSDDLMLCMDLGY